MGILVIQLLMLMLCLLPACTQPPKEQVQSPIIDLVDSTNIIRSLIHRNALDTILEEHSPAELDLLINNVSPAKMAFEVEVLSSTVPLVIVYYFIESPESRGFINQLQSLAATLHDTVKCVVIDVEKLFSVAQEAHIEEIPTLLFVKNREIIDEMVGEISFEALEQKLKALR